MSKGDMKHVGLTVAAIFIAGLAMNALRSNQFVGQAIAGYDS
jgi:ABC-type enterochelin transport system permease subunit